MERILLAEMGFVSCTRALCGMAQPKKTITAFRTALPLTTFRNHGNRYKLW